MMIPKGDAIMERNYYRWDEETKDFVPISQHRFHQEYDKAVKEGREIFANVDHGLWIDLWIRDDKGQRAFWRNEFLTYKK